MMQRPYLSLVLLLVAGPHGCAPEPYLRLKGAVTSTIAVSRPTFDASGLRLNITGMECHVSVVEHWCPESHPACRPDPTVVKDEPATCPQDVMPGKFSLHTPWGGVYPSTLAAGVLDVKIDWKAAAVDAFDGVAFRASWVVRADDGAVNVDARLVLGDGEVRALLGAIREVTGNDYSEPPADERAALTVTVSTEPNTDNGDDNHVVVAVTNHGPAPAYRVRAQLKGRAKALAGIKIPFGRINPSETKKQTQDLEKPHGADEMVDVEVMSANAARALAPHGIRLKSKHVNPPSQPPAPPPPPAPPQLSCLLPAKLVVAGQRLRVPCEASNLNDKPVKGVTYKVSIANAPPILAPGPTDLEPNAAPSKFDVDVTLPADATPGSVQVTVTANAPDGPTVRQDISLDVIEHRKLCKPGELTIDDYHRKHKLLDEERNAGNITKEEFNDYLAELWSCVRRR